VKHIVIIVTLDTKSVEAAYLRDRIRELGHEALILDTGCGGPPQMEADITADEVARAAGGDLKAIRKARDRETASATMIRGAVAKLGDLVQAGEAEGLVAIGGTSSAIWASSIYREMPYRIPKLLMTTAAAMPQAGQFFGPTGVTVMHCLVEVGAPLNRLLMGELARAAGAICGMVDAQNLVKSSGDLKPMVAMSTNGWVETPAQYLAKQLGEQYEIVRFHGVGLPEVVMETLIEDIWSRPASRTPGSMAPVSRGRDAWKWPARRGCLRSLLLRW
jgi:uncharacterized protein (UPF0261 family)